ncbi:glucose-6-phosphate dehydrogenase assembly protein OpcA [Actinoallomurus iriomotensis]|uniref:Oxppcycle protein OpcA n=1 Tax=Actinoallomurus iriomotensis TaxID=478107 RepID=A0A9W6RFU3_9ACTN|nr:glucose-6-phosphate dehydrogenase assembly protein OpcA [Actinoallomurus iriomotensis]GLY73845.1 hypothetical protein Airi01_021120 [Actinoallomurus iriomotensis]
MSGVTARVGPYGTADLFVFPVGGILRPRVSTRGVEMIIDLVDTTTHSIEDALTAARDRVGGPAVGNVLTLVIVTTEADQYDALRASAEASREHPSRVIAVIPRGSDEATRMDAEIHVAEAGPGEIVLLRLYGLLVRHAESVVSPLLVPDAPLVTWWPGFAPERPGDGPLGRPAQRRVTDAVGNADPLGALERLGKAYLPGDTDLSWTRLTPWRSLPAAELDRPHDEVTGAVTEAEPRNPSAVLLGGWPAGSACRASRRSRAGCTGAARPNCSPRNCGASNRMTSTERPSSGGRGVSSCAVP